MEITKDSQGWRIIPSTSDEAKVLAMLLEPLKEYYDKSFETGTRDVQPEPRPGGVYR